MKNSTFVTAASTALMGAIIFVVSIQVAPKPRPGFRLGYGVELQRPGAIAQPEKLKQLQSALGVP